MISPAPHEADFAALKAQLVAAGCFRYAPWRSLASYVAHLVAAAGLFVACRRVPWVAPALFAFGSVVFYRIGWLMHDAAHGAVFAKAAPNRAFALLTAATLGEFPSGWRYGHNRHHAAPNVKTRDLDNAQRWNDPRRYDGPLRAFVEVLLVVRLGRLVLPQTVLLIAVRDGYFCRAHARRRFPLELALVLAGTAAQVAFFCRVFGAIGAVLFFVHTMIGALYLNVAFVGNHYDLDAFDDEAAAAPLDFFELQVRTTRNYPDGLVARFLYGGLEHQIEHHLFPNLPRHAFGRAAPFVREACARRGLPYASRSLPRCLLGVLGFHARTPAPAKGGGVGDPLTNRSGEAGPAPE
jgi:fatty acid desaturase